MTPAAPPVALELSAHTPGHAGVLSSTSAVLAFSAACCYWERQVGFKQNMGVRTSICTVAPSPPQSRQRQWRSQQHQDRRCIPGHAGVSCSASAAPAFSDGCCYLGGWSGRTQTRQSQRERSSMRQHGQNGRQTLLLRYGRVAPHPCCSGPCVESTFRPSLLLWPLRRVDIPSTLVVLALA